MNTAMSYNQPKLQLVTVSNLQPRKVTEVKDTHALTNWLTIHNTMFTQVLLISTICEQL